MSSQPGHKEVPKPSKGKGKGARRVSNLSEEQRTKKRENDRIAQQNIRRRNKELIENLQREVAQLRRLEQVDGIKQVLRQNEELQNRVRCLEKHLYQLTGQTFSPSVFDVDGLPPSRHTGNYSVPQTFGSPCLAAANPYDQWPSNVVSVPSAVTVNSVESSPGTPAYVHTSVPIADGAVMPSSTSAPSIASAKSEYQELDAGPANNRYLSREQHSYLHESPWPVYQTNTYYSRATDLLGGGRGRTGMA